MKQTVEVRNIVQTVASKYNVRSLLDVPCGDLNWMRKVEFEHGTSNQSTRHVSIHSCLGVLPLSETNTLLYIEVEYIGGDIVRGLIKFDRERFGNTSRKFIVMDMVSQQPYKPFDLIVTRDAFVHLPDRQVKKIIDNFNKVRVTVTLLLDLVSRVMSSMINAHITSSIEWLEVLADDVVPRS